MSVKVKVEVVYAIPVKIAKKLVAEDADSFEDYLCSTGCVGAEDEWDHRSNFEHLKEALGKTLVEEVIDTSRQLLDVTPEENDDDNY